MRTPSELLQAEADFTKAWREYQRACFTATTFAALLLVIAGVMFGAAVQMERQARQAAIARAV
jgi:hypothetical protein